MAKQWQIKHNDKVHGPVSDSQLRKLVSSGRINRKTPIRANENSIWMVAERVPGLFPDEPAGGGTLQTGSVQFVPTSEGILDYADVEVISEADSEEIWRVGHDGKTFGPFSVEQLTERVRSGWLRPADLVWKPGLPKWEPATTISGLFPKDVPPPLPVAPGIDHSESENSVAIVGGKRSRTRKALRYAMLVTVLASPVLWFLILNWLYNGVVAAGRGFYSSNEKAQLFGQALVLSTTISFVVLSFCLAVEGLLLFAMKDDKA